MQVLSTDVAIVGGGAAGCYAALNLQRAGLRSVILCKGLVGKSGASIFAGNLVLSGRALGNTDEQARNTAEFLIKYHNQFLIDQQWARRCGQFIESVYYPELEEAGSTCGATRRATSSPAPARSAASPPTSRAIRACRSWTSAASRSSGRAFRGWRNSW